jgi:hypothetical protein
MKFLLGLFVFFLVATNVFGQRDSWVGAGFFQIGFQGGKTEYEKMFYQMEPYYGNPYTGHPSDTNALSGESKAKEFSFNMQFLGTHALFTFGMGYAGKRALPGGLYSREYNLFNTRLAFGGYFGKYVGLYLGAQYNYNIVEFQGSLNSQQYPNYQFTQILGGNQRGLGAHLVLPLGEHLMIRGSYMYDWIFREHKRFKGLAKTPEVEIVVPFDEDKTFGFTFRVSMPKREMYDTYNPDEPQLGFVPGTTFNSMYYQFSLILPASIFGSYSQTYTTVRVVE